MQGDGLKNKDLTAARLLITLASIGIVAYSVDLDEAASVISGIDFVWATVALLVFWTAQVIASQRFIYIAKALGRTLPLHESIKVHFIALWFNQVLPTSIGGDIVKIGLLKNPLGLGVAVRTTLLDRFSGLFILVLAIVAGLPYYARIFTGHSEFFYHVLQIASVTFIGATVLSGPILDKFQPLFNRLKFLEPLVTLIRDVWKFRKGKDLWNQLWTSTLVHISGVSAYGLLGLALGYDVNPLGLFLVVPLVFLVALIPVSLAGWGVREVGAIWLFHFIGVSKETALAISVSYGLMLVVSSLPGLIYLMLARRNTPALVDNIKSK